MNKPKFRTRFHPSKKVTFFTPASERRTKSEFLKETDINFIMERYRRTGQLPESARQAATRYGDFSQIPDFMEMQHRVIAAHEMFAALPAKVRKEFENDPGQFIAAAQTEEGRELLVKLGLGKPQESDSQPPGEAVRPSPAGTHEAPAGKGVADAKTSGERPGKEPKPSPKASDE